MTTQKQSPQSLPIYVQIAELLTRDIISGRLIDGERLPPERDMAAELGVSVGTLRKALRDMGQKGLIESVQGSGNYIRASGDTGTVYAMFRLELLEGGGLPRARVLSVDQMDKPADLPDFGTAARGTRIRRLRSLNDTIIAVEEIWLDADAGIVSEATMSESLYATYRKELGLWIQRAEDRVSLGTVPHWAPDTYGPRPGDTVGYVERLSWADAAAPIEFSRTWYDPARAVYVQRMK
ncbi:GntR family transcriptional regulator [Tateyamaria omphalii]|uniref:GntR family transcriptional regulator n=1 Tax=Tateyamaria omphalii TaxID=299262 RepID=UPI001675FFCB|nr:GntR family transcriptional regulator [Tateyamaria omphalii]GGX59109.1 GntR family transcriptional regulator [Tateyamaria omphalii]